MRPSIKHLLVLAPFIFLLGSCGSKKATVLVPKDAAVVWHYNMASLSSKLSWNEIISAEWFKMIAASSEEDDELTPLQKSILENPDNSGVDFKSDLYFFYQIRGTHAYAVAVGQLSDSKKFESAISSVGPMMRIKKEGAISYTGNDEGCLTWTDNRFIVVAPSKAPDNNFGSRRRYGYDDDDRNDEVIFDSLLHFAKDIYGLTKASSISGDSHFSSLMKETGDMHMLFNSNAFMQNSLGPLKMLKAAEFLEGNATGLAINFGNGKITVDSKSWYGKELGALMKKFQPGNLNADMLKRIPSQNLIGVIALNYPPKGVKEFMKAFGLDGLVNSAIGEVGLTIDDFVKANKGDVMLAVSDFSIKERTITIPMDDGEPFTHNISRPDANFIFATSVNDKPAFLKLMNAVKNEINKKPGAAKDTAQVKYVLSDKWFVMGNNQAAVDSFTAGSNTGSAALISQISGHPIGGFIDLQKIFAGISLENGMRPSTGKMLAMASQSWDNIVFYGGEIKDGAGISHFEINLKDKGTNSLKQLYTFLGKMANEERKERLRYLDEEMDMPPSAIDSIGIIEPKKIEDKK